MAEHLTHSNCSGLFVEVIHEARQLVGKLPPMVAGEHRPGVGLVSKAEKVIDSFSSVACTNDITNKR